MVFSRVLTTIFLALYFFMGQTHFIPLFSFYNPWKHHKTSGFLFSGGIERASDMKWAKQIQTLKKMKWLKKQIFCLPSLITCSYKTITTIISTSYVSFFNFNTLSFSKLLSRFWNSSNSVMSSPTNPSSVLAISKSSSLIVIGRNDEGGGAGKGGWIYNNKLLSN